jgi:hypothetical protein
VNVSCRPRKASHAVAAAARALLGKAICSAPEQKFEGFADAGERLCLAGQTPFESEALLLNRYDRPSPMNGEAEVKYLDGDFRVVRPGAFVRCAVTGVPIPLEELKYWSVDLQEAYATPEAVLQRHRGTLAANKAAD